MWFCLLSFFIIVRIHTHCTNTVMLKVGFEFLMKLFIFALIHVEVFVFLYKVLALQIIPCQARLLRHSQFGLYCTTDGPNKLHHQ